MIATQSCTPLNAWTRWVLCRIWPVQPPANAGPKTAGAEKPGEPGWWSVGRDRGGFLCAEAGLPTGEQPKGAGRLDGSGVFVPEPQAGP
jgi:hypothetical protein